MSNTNYIQISHESVQSHLNFLMYHPTFLELFPCAVYLLKDEEDLKVLHGNTAFYTLFGCTEETMLHKYASRLSALVLPESLHELDAPGVRNPYVPFTLRLHIKRDGLDAWIDTQAIRCKYEDSGIILCVSSDATENHQKLTSARNYFEKVAFAAKQLAVDAFEYDLLSQTIHMHFPKIFLCPTLLGTPSTLADLMHAVTERNLVHPDYLGSFQGAFDSIEQGHSKAICELRMKTKNQEYAWARLTLVTRRRGEDAEPYAVGILEDINGEKELSLQYLNETQFYQVLLSEKTAYAQVDVTEDRCLRCGGLWNLYNEIIQKVPYSKVIYEFINKVVHPEDRRHYLELMQPDNFIQSLEDGVDQLGCEFRRIVEQNKMSWMQLKVHLLRDSYTHHVLALLSIKDIDARKRQELALLHDSERDSLTMTFNKKMTENSIRNYLKQMSQMEQCAFIILDLDDFKSVNDNYGHKAGDRILIRLGEVLRDSFRQNGIVGRFGGDEFIIFLKNISSKDKVRESMEHLYKRLQGEKEPGISCSIGITIAPFGSSYERIFRQADIALYAAKNEGKGRYAFFRNNFLNQLPEAASSEREAPLAPKELLLQNEPIEDEMTFESFLAEQGDMAYLVEPETFALVCGNKAFYDRIGRTKTECIGIKCYEAMHKRESPCPFCSKANWSTDKFYLWKNMNHVLEQEFLIKNRLVQWNGRELLLAIAVDISNNKSVVDSMENGATESHSILSGVQRMNEAETLEDVLYCAMETIGYFFQAGIVRFWERKSPEEPYRCISAWCSGEVKNTQPAEDAVNSWLHGQNWEQPVRIESPEAMLCHSYELYQYMKNTGIANQRWLQLRDGEQEQGCIDVENITSNFQNVAFLESFCIFISAEIKKRRLTEQILYANKHDDLTDLLSRSSFEQYLHEYSQDQVSSIGVMVADFDNLKGINNTRGFSTGNYFLKHFANLLKTVFPHDSLFRLNGDEFLAITVNNSLPDLENKVRSLKDRIQDNNTYTISLGYSWDDVEKDLSRLIKQATEAMKLEKYRHYDIGMVSKDIERGKMLSELVNALENHEFEVYLQPKVEYTHNKIIGAEALIRYRHKELGILSPVKFVGILESNNLIRYIDLFVFEEVCRILEQWKQEGKTLPVISLNFSRLTLLERDILSNMERIISKYDVSKQYIEIEITESVANIGKSILYQAARELCDAGYSISLDDFGTEYTNLSILADIDFNMLKLDKSLIGALVNQTSNQIILKNIIRMCKDLGIEEIAEGVETKAQEDVLRKLECRLGQGYLYGRPMPIHEFEQMFHVPDNEI